MDLILIGSFEVRRGRLDIIIVKPFHTWAMHKVHKKLRGRSFLCFGSDTMLRLFLGKG